MGRFFEAKSIRSLVGEIGLIRTQGNQKSGNVKPQMVRWFGGREARMPEETYLSEECRC